MSKIKKLRDWRARLSSTIEARRRIPFSEKNNCGVFLADCLLTMTGDDTFASLRGRTRAESLAVLQRAGFADFPSFIASYFDEISPSFAVAGDIMAFPTEQTGWAAGIVNGERVIVLGEGGVGTIPRDKATRAFRIP